MGPEEGPAGTRTFLLGLGGNVGQVPEAFVRATSALAACAHVELLAYSRLYRTPAQLRAGAPAQPDYVNAVCLGRTSLAPLALLELLQAIEAREGPRDPVRWSPRRLDLDYLADEKNVQQAPRLTIPHPRAAERAFVLLPARDVAPDVRVGPNGATATALVAKLPPAAWRNFAASVRWREPTWGPVE